MASSLLSDFAASAQRLAPVLIDIAVRSVVMLALTALGALCMRRASAAARHWVWLLGMAALLLLPLISATLPGWHILPRVGTNIASTFIIEAPDTMSALPEGASPAASATPVDQAAASAPNTEIPNVHQRSVPAAAVLTAPSPQNSSASPLIGTAPAPARTSLPRNLWVMLVWIGGAAMIFTYILLGFLSLWVLQRRCAPIREETWQQLLFQLQQAMRLGGAVDLLSSPQRAMPMTWGLLRTRLLLPEQANEWPLDQRRAVLLHELAHARRWDCLTQLLAQIACAVYWFNPLVWVAWHRMQVERENACDDLVLNTGTQASAYAEHLLRTASEMPSLRFARAAAIAMARPSTLEERLRAILDPRRNRRAMGAAGALATLLLLMMALVPVAVLKAQQNPAPAPAPAAAAPQQAETNPPLSIEEQMRLRRMQATQAEAGRGGRGAGLAIQPEQAPPTALQGPTCPLEAVVYDVRMPVDLVGRLDVNALAQAAATPDDFEKALAALGTSQSLYRANQSVRLNFDTIAMGQDTPYVTGSNVTATGQVINRVSYSRTGALFNLRGRVGAGGRIELDMNIQVSALTESPTQIAADIKAPFFRTVNMSRKGVVDANKAFVVVSIDAANPDPNGKAVAYIARVTLGTPQSAADATPGQ